MLLKVGSVFLTFRLHPFVPESEIQAKVKAVLGVVQAVMRSPDEPTAQPVLVKAFWVDLYIGVVDGTGQGHESEEGHDGPVMHGQK